MKLRNLFMAAVAGAFALTACEDEIDLGVAKLSIDPLELTFGPERTSQSITMVATRDWFISSELPEWIAVSPTSGQANSKEQTLTVTVLENKGNDRETTVGFSIGMIRASLNVKQAGEMGEYVVPTVTCAEFIKTDGQTEYIISGRVTNVNTSYKYAYISDGTAEVEVYQPSNWEEYADKIKVGATLKAQGVYTKYTNASGKSYDELVGVILSIEEATPQTEVTEVTCAEFIQTDGITEYIISGKVTNVNTNYKYAYISDGTAEVEVYQPSNWEEYADKITVGSTLKAQGVYTKYTNASGKTYDELVGVILSVEEATPQTEVTEVTCAEFIKTDGTTEYIISGKVTNVNTNYKYAYINDGTAEVEVYQPTNWEEFADKITVGSTLKAQGVYSQYTNASGKTYDELVGKILSVEEGEVPQPQEVKTVTIAEFNAAEESSTQPYKLTGTIGGTINTQYGNFDLTDDTGTVYVYGLTATDLGYGAKNDQSFASLNLAEGDVITIIGYRGSYSGKIEVVYAYFVEKVGTDNTPKFGVEKTEINVSASATGAEIKVTGNVDWTATSTAIIEGGSVRGSGAGSFTVAFDANTDTENTKVYTATVTTTANVANKEIVVTITQGKAGTGEILSVTVAEFIAAEESETQLYKLNGKIGGSINSTYGNFDLTDETGTVYVYGLTATELGYGATNDKSFSSLNLKDGDEITIIGYRGSYGDKIEVVYAYFVEKTGEAEQEQPEPGTSIIEFVVSEYAAANGWENSKQYLVMDKSGVTITASGKTNTGKFYTNGNDWRFYQNEDAQLGIAVSEDLTFVSVTFTYSVQNTGMLVDTTGAEVKSGEKNTCQSFAVKNSGSATNGQVRFTKIAVTVK